MSLEKKGWIAPLAFFVGAPILLSLPLGFFQAAFGQFLPVHLSIVFWAVAWLATWLISEILLRMLHGLLRPWKPPLMAEIVVSNILAILASALYLRQYMLLFEPYSEGLPTALTKGGVNIASAQYLMSLFQSGLPGFVAWTLLRPVYAALPPYIAERACFGTKAQEEEPDVAPRPAPPETGTRLSRFGRELHQRGIGDYGQIAALRASDHYVSVHLFDGREEFILSRFADALEEVAAQDGLRIHRSFWISCRAIERVEREGSSTIVHLSNGMSCPVSVKYQGLFEHLIAQTGTFHANRP